MIVRRVFAGRAAAREGVRDLMCVLRVRLNVKIRSVMLEYIEPARNDARVLEFDAGFALCAVNGRYRAGLDKPRKDILLFSLQYTSNVLRSLTCVV